MMTQNFIIVSCYFQWKNIELIEILFILILITVLFYDLLQSLCNQDN
jgi:hypothetical protein